MIPKQHLELMKAINDCLESVLLFLKTLAEFEWAAHEWRIMYVKKNFSKIPKYKFKEILEWSEEIEFMIMDN